AALAKTDAGLKRLSEEVAQANARARQQVERPVAVKPTAAPPRENVVPARPPQRRADAERPHESASQATAEAVSPPPAPAPKAAAVAASAHKPAPSAAASAPQDPRDQSVTDKVRKDWATIRKGFS